MTDSRPPPSPPVLPTPRRLHNSSSLAKCLASREGRGRAHGDNHRMKMILMCDDYWTTQPVRPCQRLVGHLNVGQIDSFFIDWDPRNSIALIALAQPIIYLRWTQNSFSHFVKIRKYRGENFHTCDPGQILTNFI